MSFDEVDNEVDAEDRSNFGVNFVRIDFGVNFGMADEETITPAFVLDEKTFCCSMKILNGPDKNTI